jgi:hypothetical protein
VSEQPVTAERRCFPAVPLCACVRACVRVGAPLALAGWLPCGALPCTAPINPLNAPIAAMGALSLAERARVEAYIEAEFAFEHVLEAEAEQPVVATASSARL